MKTKLLCLSLLLLNAGCAEWQSAQTQKALEAIDLGQKPEDVNPDLDRPACEVAYDEYQMQANIMSFEIHGKNGANLGFNLGGILRFFGLNFKTERGRMTMSMSLHQTIQPRQPIAYVTGSAEMKKREFSFDLGVWKLGLGFDHFYQTPLAELSSRAVNDSLKNLQWEFEEAGSRWQTKVAFVDGLQVVLPVGGASGVRPGDRFNIYNVKYIWKDPKSPCESELLMAIPTTTEPLAEAVAVGVRENATSLRVESYNSEEPMQVGALVEINRLTGKPEEVKNRRLRRTARVGQVQSQPIVIKENETLDLRVPVSEQIRANMDKYHFHPVIGD